MNTATLSPPPRPPKDRRGVRDTGEPDDGPRRRFGWLIFLKLAVIVALVATAGFVAARFLRL